MDRSRRRPKKKPKQSAKSVISTREATAREATEKTSKAATETARRDDAELGTRELDTTASRAAVDTPELKMTVEEWTTVPVLGACRICAGPRNHPGAGGFYCPACRQFNYCVDCKDNAIVSCQFAEGGCVYQEQRKRLGEPRWENTEEYRLLL